MRQRRERSHPSHWHLLSSISFGSQDAPHSSWEVHDGCDRSVSQMHQTRWHDWQVRPAEDAEREFPQLPQWLWRKGQRLLVPFFEENNKSEDKIQFSEFLSCVGDKAMDYRNQRHRPALCSERSQWAQPEASGDPKVVPPSPPPKEDKKESTKRKTYCFEVTLIFFQNYLEWHTIIVRHFRS